MALKAETDRVVKLAYRITDPEGRLIEERTPEDPYEYLQGRGQIVGPVERAVNGKTPGFQAEINVTPRDGYGEYDAGLVAEIPLAGFPPGQKIEVGMKFNTSGPSGKVVTVRVVELDDSSVTVDANHPLAGLDLIFEIRVLDVREASAEELDAGRVDPPVDIESEPTSGTVH